MTKLGSKKKPLILRVANEDRARQVTNLCLENDWHFILGIEPDKQEDISDLERKLNPPMQRMNPKQGRNDICSCGSGKKYKKCCLMERDINI